MVRGEERVGVRRVVRVVRMVEVFILDDMVVCCDLGIRCKALFDVECVLYLATDKILKEFGLPSDTYMWFRLFEDVFNSF